ncbi:hypothetical protein ABT095_15590 [Kitasatospora sp. NPDC002227]|uniref:hypothetical protein n=1 Tax=Kitasatospora sp. NPDC002227 TaxID=3154773 RepID=UPI00332AFC17
MSDDQSKDMGNHQSEAMGNHRSEDRSDALTLVEVLEAGEPEQPKAPKSRRGLVRLAAAALVFALTGTAAALAVAAPERTALPGLRTPNDGRYSFAPLTLPALPSGKPKPDGVASVSRHYADLRGLLLPEPKGATREPVAHATPQTTDAAFVRCTDYAARDLHPALYTTLLTESACRAAAERVWTGPDGTRTELWLLGFGSAAEAGPFYLKAASDNPIDLPGLQDLDSGFVPVGSQTVSAYRATQKTAGDHREPIGRVGYLQAGDVLAVVVMTNPKGVPAQAFRQVVTLQDQLLQ